MKKLFCLALLASAVAATAVAQEGEPSTDLRRDLTPSMTHSSVTPTPEMWFYQQERDRYEDPKAAVRRNAEFRAAQRHHRVEAMKWFGLSNSRPTASSTPVMGTYSPTWSSNTYDPFRWSAARPGVYVLRPSVGLY